jgi:lipoprotein signal peptidase
MEKPVPKLIFYIYQFLIFVVLVAFDLLLAHFIKSSSILITPNTYPLGLVLPVWFVVLAAGFVSFGLVKFEFLSKHPVFTLLIIAGMASNLLERITFGFVADYINIGIAIANIADLQIWSGVIALNYLTFTEVNTSLKKVFPN